MPTKLHPDYLGVDLKAQPFVDEYFAISKQYNIEFNNKVTIGFKNINYGNVIGICTIAPHWREIDLDIGYWLHSTNTSHLALVAHELTHCYCGRKHDYGDDKNYPETTEKRVNQVEEWFKQKSGKSVPGYMDDGCPLSLMYPEVLDDECTRAHWQAYVQELFDRCKPF